MNIPFFKPHIDEETIAAVNEVLRSGWLTMGPKTAEFEKLFADYVQTEHAVMVNSCTAALHLCLAAIDLRPGDEVITTTYTFAASAEVIEYFDARPVFVDIRPDTMNIDEATIEDKITPKARAIIPVHFAGQPCEMDAIMDIAKRHNLYVFEDAAHCTPAFYKDRSIGSIGNATCFSFYANKCITTGEGGMITTNDTALAEKFKILRLHGLSRDAAERYNKKGSWKYDIVARGYKYNPTDIAAAIGIGQLKKSDEFFKERLRVVREYQKLLNGITELQLVSESDCARSSWHIFPVRLVGANAGKRNQIINQLKDAGIATSVHFIPLHCHSYYKQKYNFRDDEFPCAYDSYSRLITLPVYPALRAQEIEFICTSLIELVREG